MTIDPNSINRYAFNTAHKFQSTMATQSLPQSVRDECLSKLKDVIAVTKNASQEDLSKLKDRISVINATMLGDPKKLNEDILTAVQELHYVINLINQHSSEKSISIIIGTLRNSKSNDPTSVSSIIAKVHRGKLSTSLKKRLLELLTLSAEFLNNMSPEKLNKITELLANVEIAMTSARRHQEIIESVKKLSLFLTPFQPQEEGAVTAELVKEFASSIENEIHRGLQFKKASIPLRLLRALHILNLTKFLQHDTSNEDLTLIYYKLKVLQPSLRLFFRSSGGTADVLDRSIGDTTEILDSLDKVVYKNTSHAKFCEKLTQVNAATYNIKKFIFINDSALQEKIRGLLQRASNSLYKLDPINLNIMYSRIIILEQAISKKNTAYINQATSRLEEELTRIKKSIKQNEAS